MTALAPERLHPADLDALAAKVAEHLAGEAPRRSYPRPALDAAVELLHGQLADGPLPAAEVERAAESVGISTRSLRRARTTAGVESIRVGFGPGAVRWWRFPGHELPVEPMPVERHPEALDAPRCRCEGAMPSDDSCVRCGRLLSHVERGAVA